VVAGFPHIKVLENEQAYELHFRIAHPGSHVGCRTGRLWGVTDRTVRQPTSAPSYIADNARKRRRSGTSIPRPDYPVASTSGISTSVASTRTRGGPGFKTRRAMISRCAARTECAAYAHGGELAEVFGRHARSYWIGGPGDLDVSGVAIDLPTRGRQSTSSSLALGKPTTPSRHLRVCWRFPQSAYGLPHGWVYALKRVTLVFCNALI
jgi:hypothetical protein